MRVWSPACSTATLSESLDLYQLHAVTNMEVLDERAPAVEAILRARDEGLVRFVGIAGHDQRAGASADMASEPLIFPIAANA